MPKFIVPLTIELPEPEKIDLDALTKELEDGFGSADKGTELICVLGPTASGKTRYAVGLAREINRRLGRKVCEIISADSRQVYYGMDIGTGKDLSEYGEIPHHLLDIMPAGSKYNVYQFQKDFSEAFTEIRERKGVPILCGGTGMYIDAVTRNYDFSKKRKDIKELPRHTFYIGTLVSREERLSRIDARLEARLQEGLVEEIKRLLESGVKPEELIYYGLEYKYVTEYVLGRLSYEEMFRLLSTAIHQFAKRQMTWFRGMERRGCVIHWVEP